MNKVFKNMLWVAAGAALLTGCGSPKSAESSQESSSSAEAAKKMTVYTSTDPIFDFASQIAGDRVQLVNLMPSGADAHHWEPSAQDIAAVSEADLLLLNGAQYEMWLSKVTDALGDHVKVVDTSTGVDLIRVSEDHDHEEHAEEASHDHEEHAEEADHDHEHAHVHGEFDPHYWMDVKAAEQQAKNVLQALIEADPEGKETYEANFAALQSKFDALNASYEKELKPFAGKSIVVPHEAFGYLCRRFNLQQVGIEGLLADGEPNAVRMKEIIDLAKAQGITAVFYEANEDPKLSEQIASEIGATTLPLHSLETITEEERAKGKDYFSIMEDNLKVLVQSFGAAQ